MMFLCPAFQKDMGVTSEAYTREENAYELRSFDRTCAQLNKGILFPITHELPSG